MESYKEFRAEVVRKESVIVLARTKEEAIRLIEQGDYDVTGGMGSKVFRSSVVPVEGTGGICIGLRRYDLADLL